MRTLTLLATLLLLAAACGEPPAAGPGGDAETPLAGGPLAPDCDDVEDVVVREPRDEDVVDIDTHAIVEDVEAYGRDEAPESFGGVWVDGERVVAAFSTDHDRHEDALADRWGGRIRVAEVEHSERELEPARAAVEDLLDDERLGPSVIQAWGTDVMRNRVAVDLYSPSDEARALLAGELGAELVCIRPLAGVGRDAEPGGGAEGVVEIPTTDAPNLQQALVEGVLDGDAGEECVWLATPAGTRMPVVWPPGYGARFGEPIELVDETGAVVARAGDDVALGGGSGPADPGGHCMLGQDSAWIAGSVQADRP